MAMLNNQMVPFSFRLVLSQPFLSVEPMSYGNTSVHFPTTCITWRKKFQKHHHKRYVNGTNYVHERSVNHDVYVCLRASKFIPSAIPSSFWLPQVSMFFLIDQVWLRQELLKTSKKIQALGATEPADPGVLFRWFIAIMGEDWSCYHVLPCVSSLFSHMYIYIYMFTPFVQGDECTW